MAANKNAVRNSGIKQGLGFQEVGQTGNLAGGLSKERSKENLVEEIDVGSRLRELRTKSGFSLRSLAKLSGLNINTLSLIENGKTSPSVSTLQQLAVALHVPIAAFFEAETTTQSVVFQKVGQRRRGVFTHGTLEDLGSGLTLEGGQPLLVSLKPGADSGETPIVHTGIEFVYCLEGTLSYAIDGETYLLGAGDSLVFEAHLPHRWGNPTREFTRSLLIICPADEKEQPAERHFSPTG